MSDSPDAPDRRDLSRQFRARLKTLIDEADGGISQFARAAGVDRSALGQLLDASNVRLPRADTLRAIAERCGVTADWLLGLSSARTGGHEIAPQLGFEADVDEQGRFPPERWRAEARGYKFRAIPAVIPDMLRLPALAEHDEADVPTPEAETAGQDRAAIARLHDTAAWIEDMDVEICMPVQTLHDIAAGASVWAGLPAGLRAAQIGHVAAMAEAHYPALRIHLYDARRIMPAPYSVFGPIRAVIYLGRTYLVITAAEQVRALSRHFDGVIRESVHWPERIPQVLRAMPVTGA